MMRAADGGLDRHVEHLSGDQLLELLGHPPAVVERLVAVHDRGEGVGRHGVEQQVDLDERRLAVAGRLVVEAGVALATALELVEEVDDDLGERHHVVQLDALGRQVLELVELAAALLAQLHQRPRVVRRA